LRLKEGKYKYATTVKGVRLSGETGVYLDLFFSNALNNGKYAWGTNSWVSFFVRGDIGKHFSYSFTAGAGLLRYPQTYLGSAPACYQGFVPSDNASINRDIPAYRQDAYFPWTENVIWIGRAQNVWR